MLHKNNWSREVFDTVDWKAMQIYMKSLSGEKATNVIKLVHNWQNDGHQKHKHSKGEKSGACPACGEMESHLHFIS